jgi:hypothetical protein
MHVSSAVAAAKGYTYRANQDFVIIKRGCQDARADGMALILPDESSRFRNGISNAVDIMISRRSVMALALLVCRLLPLHSRCHPYRRLDLVAHQCHRRAVKLARRGQGAQVTGTGRRATGVGGMAAGVGSAELG